MPSGRQISAPPNHADYEQWSVPKILMEDVEFANKVTFGKRGESWKITEHRICWWVHIGDSRFFYPVTHACEIGTRSHPAKISSYRRTQHARDCTSRHVVRSTGGNSSLSSATMSCGCWRASWSQNCRGDGRGTESSQTCR